MKMKTERSGHHYQAFEELDIQRVSHNIVNELVSTVSIQHARYLNATQEQIKDKFRFILNILKTIGLTDLRSDFLTLTVTEVTHNRLITAHHNRCKKSQSQQPYSVIQNILCSWIMLTMGGIQVEGKMTAKKIQNALTRIKSYSFTEKNTVFTLTLDLPKIQTTLDLIFQEEKNIDNLLLRAFLVLMDLTVRTLMSEMNQDLSIQCDYFKFNSILVKNKHRKPPTVTIDCPEIKNTLHIITRAFFEKLLLYANKTRHLQIEINNQIISIMLPETRQDHKLMIDILIENYRNRLQAIIDNETFDNAQNQLQQMIKIRNSFLPWSLGTAELCQESLLLTQAKNEMHLNHYTAAFNTAVKMINFYLNSKKVNKGYLFQAYSIAVEATIDVQNLKKNVPLLHQLFNKIPLQYKTHNGDLTKTHCQLKLAYCYRLLGEFEFANQLLDEAIVVSKRENDTISHCKSLVQRSEYDLKFQRYTHAYENLNVALNLSSSISHKPTKFLIFDRLGCLFKHTECFDAALFHFNKSLKLANESTDWHDIQSTKINLASLHFQMREYNKTTEILYKLIHNEQFHRLSKAEKFRANKLLGTTCLKLKDYRQAIKLYNVALQLINSNISPATKSNVIARLAQAHLLENELQKSFSHCKESFGYLNHTWKKLLNDEQRIAFSDNYNLPLKILQQIYWLQSKHIDALNMAEAQKTRAFKYQLLLENSKLQFNIQTREHYLTLASRFNTCFIFYSENPNKQTHIWVITSRSIQTATTRIDQSVIESTVSTINSLYSRSSSTKESTLSPLKSNLIDLLKQAYQAIISPIEKMIINEPDITIIPPTNLHRFPFSALYNNDGTPLIEHHRIRIISSLSMLAMLYLRYNTTHQAARPPNVLLVSCKKSTEHKDSLPHSNQETTNIASFFKKNEHGLKCTHLSDEQASIKQVTAALHHNDVIHFATHGKTEGPLLSDGILSQEIISTMTLPSLQSIIFSMCNSLQPKGVLLPEGNDSEKKCRISIARSDGVNSIARSFLIAGAHTTFTTLFPVEDEFCLIFMNLFYKILLKIGNGNASLALQLTIKTIRKQNAVKSKRGHSFKHKDELTHLWAPFVVYGLGLIPFYSKSINRSSNHKRKHCNTVSLTDQTKQPSKGTISHSTASTFHNTNTTHLHPKAQWSKRRKHHSSITNGCYTESKL